MHERIQFTFDYVAEFLLEQDSACQDELGCCYYEMNGMHCAVGCLLRAGEVEGLEGRPQALIPLDSFRSEFTDGIKGHEHEFRSLLTSLQHYHDEYSGGRSFSEYLIETLLKDSEDAGYDPSILITWMD